MKIVSFSLWGNHPAYYSGAIKNAKLINNEFYLGWKSWFFVGSEAPKDYIQELSVYADKIIFVNRNDFSLTFERFSSILYENVEIAVSRDTDSRVCDKEYQAVLEWEDSDKIFHSMRDHRLHNFPIMAGMWGVKKNIPELVMKEYKEIYDNRSDKFQSDQQSFCNFYKKFSKLFLEHDDLSRYNGKKFPDHEGFKFGSYIGQRIDSDDTIGSEMKSFNQAGY